MTNINLAHRQRVTETPRDDITISRARFVALYRVAIAARSGSDALLERYLAQLKRIESRELAGRIV